MGMRETERSLRWYFLLAGTIGIAMSVHDIVTILKLGDLLGSLPASWMLALWFPTLARLALGSGFVLAGIGLRAALPRGATWIKKLLLASLAVQVVDAILVAWVLGRELGQASVTTSIVVFAVTAYLLANLRRMADEAVAKQPPQARVT